MQLNDIKQALTKGQGHALIIGYADSNHYLAGLEDTEGAFHSLRNKQGEIVTYNSISEAGMALATVGIDNVTVQLQTPYDEMVGLQESSETRYQMAI